MSQNLELLRAKAERYMQSGQPELMEMLKRSGELSRILDQRAESANQILKQCQELGLDPAGTQELVAEALMPSPGEE